ncbi:MAG: hypothetical protein ACOY90_11270 [Candidatus Zhuqueibacterota bacterium]
MKKKHITRGNSLNIALNRFITHEIFETRILEHPKNALARTSIQDDARLPGEMKPKAISEK